MKKQGSWGANSYSKMSWKNIKNSFVKNATSPLVWGPLTGSVFFRASGWDRKIGSWYADHNLVFKNQESATDYSNTFNAILEIEMWMTGALTHSWEDDENWGQYTFNKVKGFSVLYLAQDYAHSARRQLSLRIYRPRPHKRANDSFPSGHATRAGAYHTMSSRNLDSIKMSPQPKRIIHNLNGIIVAGEIWSRVEAHAHYPSDALAGYAIGSFVSGVLFDVLMNLKPEEKLTFGPINGGGFISQYALQF